MVIGQISRSINWKMNGNSDTMGQSSNTEAHAATGDLQCPNRAGTYGYLAGTYPLIMVTWL
jgi:hypothetical protein